MSVIETTQSLVRLASVNPGYDPASRGEVDVADWLLSWAVRHGLEASTQEVFPGRQNVVLRLRNGVGPHLLLNGHTDTVAIDTMEILPFAAELRAGRVWGRGSADMKGPLACMLHALLELGEARQSWRGTITLACVVDEELGFAGIRHFLAEESGFDFAVVGEPTRFEVVRGCKGCLRFFLRAHGKAAHSSTPERGISAISAMGRAIVRMDSYFLNCLSTVRHADLGPSTGSIGLIRGGSGINIVPEFCEIKVDVRLVPGQSWTDTYTAIQQAVEKDGVGVHWEFDPHPLADMPFCLDKADSVVQSVCAAVGRDHSEVVNFSCDASKIANVGIPCLVFGPGDIAEAHTARESISVEDLDRGVIAYTQIVRGLLPP